MMWSVRSGQLARRSIAVDHVAEIEGGDEEAVLLHVLEVVRGVRCQHDPAAFGHDTQDCRPGRVAADMMQADVGREVECAAMLLDLVP